MTVIDFPNSPTNGDELQAPNKFVYEWTDNRWRNIHRPLIFPDYIWPDLGDPDTTVDPYDPTTIPVPIPQGDDDGVDDWVLEVIDFPIDNNEANLFYNMEIVQDVNITHPTYGGVGVARALNAVNGGAHATIPFVGVDPTCVFPYVRTKGSDLGFPAMAQDEADIVAPFSANPGTRYFSFPQRSISAFDGTRCCSWVDLNDALANGASTDKTQVRYRIKGTGSYIGYSGVSFARFLYANEYTAFPASNGGVTASFKSPVNVNSYAQGAVTVTSDWKYMEADTRYLSVECWLSDQFEVGDIVVEIYDPGAVPSRANLPVGFASNPELTRSIVAFDGTAGPIMRTITHGDPKRLTNTFYDQLIEGSLGDYGDLSGGFKNMDWTCLWMREGEGWYATVDSDSPQVVEGRHLYTPGDFTSHSVVVSGQYDYKTYGSVTPALGYTVANIALSPDGLLLFTLKSDGNIRKYVLSTAWDLSTVDAGVYDELDLSGWGATSFDITIDGVVIVLMKVGKVKQIILDTPWDLLTAKNSGFERDFALEEPVDICVAYDGSSIFLLDIPSDESISYSIYNYTRNI